MKLSHTLTRTSVAFDDPNLVSSAELVPVLALLRHGGMGRLFAKAYAASTLGSFLRAFTFGHVRQLDAVATRFLLALARLGAVLALGSSL